MVNVYIFSDPVLTRFLRIEIIIFKILASLSTSILAPTSLKMIKIQDHFRIGLKLLEVLFFIDK